MTALKVIRLKSMIKEEPMSNKVFNETEELIAITAKSIATAKKNLKTDQ
jgi:hypothetical protein